MSVIFSSATNIPVGNANLSSSMSKKNCWRLFADVSTLVPRQTILSVSIVQSRATIAMMNPATSMAARNIIMS